MVTVEVLRPKPDVEVPEGVFEVVARLNVDGADYAVEGDDSIFDFDMPVIGVTKHRPVAFKRNPEEWARSLPGSYRSPYLLAKVVHDDAGPAGSPYWTNTDARRDSGVRRSLLEDVVAGILGVFLRTRRRDAVARSETRETTRVP